MAQNVHADPGEGRAGVDEKNGGFTLTDNMEEIVKFAASCGRTTFCWFLFHTKGAPGGRDEELDRGGGEVGRGAESSKSVVDKHDCRRDDGRHHDQHANRTAQNT